MDKSLSAANSPEAKKRQFSRVAPEWMNETHQTGLVAVLLAAIILFIPYDIFAQTGTIRGKVTDAVTGEPLSGARVAIQGSHHKSISDVDGRFTIRGIPDGSLTLVVAHVGYSTQEVSFSVSAGEQIQRQIELSGLFFGSDDDFVIKSMRNKSRALNRQWEPVNIKSVISSEQTDRFGAITADRAVARVPGIQVSRHGELNLRGVGHDNYNVTVDGMRMGTTGPGSRGYNLEGVSTDIIQDLEVIKVLTPDMEADALAGTINIVTHRHPGQLRHLGARLGGGANTQYFLFSGPNSRASMNYAESPRDDFSFALNLSHQLNNTGWESLGVEYDVADFGSGQVDVIERVSPGFQTSEQNRISGGIQLSYQPTERASYQIRGMVNNNDGLFKRHVSTWNAGRDWIDPNTTGAENEQGSYMYDALLRDVDIQQQTWQFEARHIMNRINVNYSAGWSQGRIKREQLLFPFLIEDLNMAIDTDNRLRPAMEVTNLRLMADGTIDRRLIFMEPIERMIDEHVENNFTGRVDLEYPFGMGSFRIGSSARLTYKDGDFNEATLRTRRLSLFRFKLEKEYDKVVFDQYYLPWFIDLDGARNFVKRNRPDLIRNEGFERERSDIWNYGVAEQVYAGYGMVTLDIGRLTFLGGVRLEHTEAEYDGNLVEFDDQGAYVTTTNNSRAAGYSYLFPNAQLTYSAGQWSRVRLAYSKSMRRPDFNLLTPFELTNHQDSTLFRGNPDLEPMISDNLDMHLDFYFRDLGTFSVGLFHKWLSGFIFEENRIVATNEFAGYHERIFLNSEESAILYGLEVAWQQTLHFLPGFLRHLSAFANYTWTLSDYDVDYRQDDVTLPYQSPHVINAALDFTRGRLSAQLSYHWTDASITRLQQSTDMAPSISPSEAVYLDYYEDGWTDVSFSMRFRLSPNFQIWGDVSNLIGFERIQYAHTRDLYPIGTEFNRGREFRAGVRYSL